MPVIRKINHSDLPFLREVIDSSELFPSDLLEGMSANFLNHDDSSEIWLTSEDNGRPIAVAFCAPEQLTEGTYNLYLIAVHKSYQGQGIGHTLMHFIEDMLSKIGVRILIVETSGLPTFALTRQFYDKLGYTREAVIREFYKPGEDKIVYWKKLGAQLH